MPPRSAQSPSKRAFHPPNHPAAYRDLLLFEERLKTNSCILNRRKSRYQLFLAQLLLIIAFLLCEVLLQLDFLSVPYRYLLHAIFKDVDPWDMTVRLHSYVALGLLFVSVTTLVLFFASGMYAEKIGYANRYVPHANRALRSFNMYLNVRRPPLRSKLPFARLFSLLFSRPTSPSPSSTTSSRSSSPSPSTSTQKRAPSRSAPLSPIPPTHNPRGELIFSSRVDKNFRDGYERYRAAFERRRADRDRELRWGLWKIWVPGATWWWGKGEGKEAERDGGGSSSLVRGRASPALMGSRMGSPDVDLGRVVNDRRRAKRLSPSPPPGEARGGTLDLTP